MSFKQPIVRSAPLMRSVAIAALMGATMLANPLSAARADTATSPQAGAKTPAGAGATGAVESKGETVEQHITNLHAALKITPDQETKWKEVAQDMRENATAMDKLVAESRKTPRKT